MMKIAISNFPGSFSDEWIRYCQVHKVDYKLVDCYKSDIIDQLMDCTGLLWHWSQLDSKAILFARQLTYSLEQRNFKVFPNSKTCWHFDDKIGQKYLLESIGAPLATTDVFYDKQEAKKWLQKIEYPLVFKLRGGASSVNVRLVKNRRQANRLTNRAFSIGFSPLDRLNMLRDKIMRFRKIKSFSNFMFIIKGILRFVFPRQNDKMLPRDKGYVYFQKYISGNSYDIRIIVIGHRAFGIKRLVRKNDFRASGSGNIVFEQNEIPLGCVKMAFDLAGKLEMQSVGFDIVFENEKIKLLEISYGFLSEAYKGCSGYWDANLVWHEGYFVPEWFIIEDFIASLT